MQSNFIRIQPPDFPFWAMGNDQSNCNFLQDSRSSDVSYQTHPKKHGPPMDAISSVTRQAKPPENVVESKRTKGGYSQSPDSFSSRAARAKKNTMDFAKALHNLPFPEASQVWLEHRKLYIRESTAACYQDYLDRLTSFFTMEVRDIHIGHFISYQSQMKGKYHPASINHDLNTLAQILKHAGLWAVIQPHYRPLPLPELDPVKVMSESEEDRFFEFAAKNPEWWLAYWVASLTNNSTASGKELRMLRLGAIDITSDQPSFLVPKNMKTKDRQRRIPLNERGKTIMARLIERANSLGSTRPDHYLFPFRIKRNMFDPLRPASESWIKARWKKLVDAAMDAGAISFRITPHNLRHQAITKLLDCGIPIETVRQIAGHGVDSVVTRHYHHSRSEVMIRAMDAIDPDRKKPIQTTAQNGKMGLVKW